MATFHRRELMAMADKPLEILDSLRDASVRVYLAAHPPHQQAMEPVNIPRDGRGSLHIVAPLSFSAPVCAVIHSPGMIRDSGGPQE